MRTILSILITIIMVWATAEARGEDQKRNRRNRSRYITHIVTKGDNLYNLSKKYEVSIEDIKSANKIGSDNKIDIGQVIRIETSKVGSYSSDEDPQSQSQAGETTKDEDTAPQTETKAEEAQYIEHHVLKRETLYGLSRQYNVSILDINNANPSLRTEGLKEGAIIRIPTPATAQKREQLATPIYRDSVTDDLAAYEDIRDRAPLYDSTYSHMRREAKRFSSTEPVRATLLLPIQVGGKQNKQFAEFYQGFLLGADSIAKEGISIELNVLNTGKNTEDVDRLVSLGDLDNSDIIIGPVYNNQFAIVAPYAASMGIPIVSPLAVIDTDNPYVYQVAASDEYRYDKLYDLLEDKRVIIYRTGDDDNSLLAAVNAIAKDTITIQFNNQQKPENIGNAMSKDKENIFIVAAKGDQSIDMVLSKLISVKGTNYNKEMSVLGSSSFARSSVDRSNYFKLDVKYISPYHIDRSDEDTFEFDRKYISRYNRMPSLFAYRGYDVAVIFFGLLAEYGSDFATYIKEYSKEILRTRYKFIQDGDKGKIANSEFMLINYTPEYTITVK